MPKTKTELKKELIEVINSSAYISDFNKLEWEGMVNTMTVKQLKEAYVYFSKSKTEEDDFKLKLLFKAKLGDKYKSDIKQITEKFKKESIKKEEKVKTNADDILKKLDNI
jgi:hypothetical protein